MVSTIKYKSATTILPGISRHLQRLCSEKICVLVLGARVQTGRYRLQLLEEKKNYNYIHFLSIDIVCDILSFHYPMIMIRKGDILIFSLKKLGRIPFGLANLA